MPIIDELKNFELNEAAIVLWVFRGPRGPAASLPKYSGHWVQTTDEVDARLKSEVANEIQRIEETLSYSLLAENNEASALTIGADETNAHLLIQAAAEEEENSRAKSEKDIINSTFYCIKAVSGENVLYAVRKADSSWKSVKRKSFTSVIFNQHELTLDENPRFEIHTGVSFFVLNGELIIGQKAHFESILRYSAAHIADFDTLKADNDFSSIFSDLDVLDQHIRNNKIQLRRAQAIHAKGHYKDADFINRLRARFGDFGLNITFDDDGLIVPSPESCSDIMTALLDHRLSSAFSENVYDVQNTTQVT